MSTDRIVATLDDIDTPCHAVVTHTANRDPARWAAIAERVTPGAHAMVVCHPHDSARQACAIEDAGWEIRDTIMVWHPWGITPIVVARQSGDSRGGSGPINDSGTALGRMNDDAWEAQPVLVGLR